MMDWLIRFLIMSAAVYVISLILPGMKLRGFKSALSVSAVYGALNFVLFKVLIAITFPLVILKYVTLGIVGVLINALLLVITDKILDDFEMSGFGTAIFAAIGISLVSLVLSLIVF